MCHLSSIITLYWPKICDCKGSKHLKFSGLNYVKYSASCIYWSRLSDNNYLPEVDTISCSGVWVTEDQLVGLWLLLGENTDYSTFLKERKYWLLEHVDIRKFPFEYLRIKIPLNISICIWYVSGLIITYSIVRKNGVWLCVGIRL